MTERDRTTPPVSVAAETYKTSVRKLLRSPWGRMLGLSESGPINLSLASVFPFAWAVSTLPEEPGTPVSSKRCRTIAIVREEESAGDALRWYSTLPILLGDKEGWRVSTVVAEFPLDDARPEPAALRSFAAPQLVEEFAEDFAGSVDRPDVMVIGDCEFLSAGSVLKCLASKEVCEWIAQGTQVVLCGNTEAGIAMLADALQRSGWTTSNLHLRARRDRSSLKAGAIMVRENSVCVHIKSAQALRISSYDIAQIEANLSTLNDSWEFAESLSNVATKAEVGNVVWLPAQEGVSATRGILMLPELGLFLQEGGLEDVNNDGIGSCTVFSPAYDVQNNRIDPDPSIRLHPRHFNVGDISAAIERFDLAIRIHEKHVSKSLHTLYGTYEVRDGRVVPSRDLYPDAFDAIVDMPFDDDAYSMPELPGGGEGQADLKAAPQSDYFAMPALPMIEAEHSSVEQGATTEDDEDASPAARAAADHVSEPTVDALRATIHGLRSKLATALRERDEARRDLAHVRNDTASESKHSGTDRPYTAARVDPEVPKEWDALFTWAHRNFEGRIAFTSRARRVARKSAFRDIAQASLAISLLANEYHDLVTIGGDQCRKALDARCEELGFSIGLTGAAAQSHRTADTYTAMWEGKSYVMDKHLQGSSSRDISRGLRIYFAMVDGTVLVGHLPTHLRNALS